METKKRFISVAGAALLTLSALAAQAGDQALTAAAKATSDAQFDTANAVAPQELSSLSIKGAPINFLDHEGSIPASFTVTPGNLAGVDSVPNFSGSFKREGQVWPFIMMGTDPVFGKRTTIPTPIIAVSLELQNADLVTTTTVSVEPFVAATLASPNFEKFKYEHSGEATQFADAVQRAEFFGVMKSNWHTDLTPSVVDHVTIKVPRTVVINLNGRAARVRTYFTGTAADGNIFVLLLDRFFNQQFSNVAINGIINNQLTTNAMNVLLFPNTFLYSASANGGIGACCTLGFHTFFADDSVTPEPAWVTAYASWISPGIFSGGFEDITAMSHEISEAVNDPFLNNITPPWQFPGTTQCQNNLETGDPVEVVANATVPVTLKGEHDGPSLTFHPQTEALLQWFNGAIPSDAIHGAYSYPDVTALPAPSVVCH